MNISPKRILFVTHHRTQKTHIPMRVEGMARAYFQKYGAQITILCTADRNRLHSNTSLINGITFVETPDLFWGKLRSGWDPWNAWCRYRWLNGKKFDLIHVFESRPAIIHPILFHLKKCPTPMVMDWCDWWGRGGLINENRPKWYRFLFGNFETYYEENFRKHADTTTIISRGLKARTPLKITPQDTIYWIPNGCWPERIPVINSSTHRSEFSLPEGKILMGFNAMDVTVGLDLVLAGFEAAAKKESKITLVLSGRISREIEETIKNTEVRDRIIQLGYVSSEAFPRMLSCMDAFILPFTNRPANWGRWPGRINDYLCAGRPIITQSVGEMKILFNEESIGLTCEESPHALADSILKMARSPEQRTLWGAQARKLAEGPLDWQTLAIDLHRAYQKAIEISAEKNKDRL